MSFFAQIFKFKLREKILVASVLIAAVPFIISNVFWFTNATSLVRKDAERSLVSVTEQATVRVDEFLNSKLLGFLAHSQGAALLSSDTKLIQDDLLNLLLQDRDIVMLTYVDMKGNELMKISLNGIYPKSDLTNVAASDAFRVANFQFGKEYLGPVEYSEDKTPEFTVAVPIVNPDKSAILQTFSSSSVVNRGPQEFKGFLIGRISLARLYNSVSQLKTGTNGYVYVVDKAGTILAHPKPSLNGVSNKELSDTEIDIFKQQTHFDFSVHTTTGTSNKEVLSTHNVIERTGWGIIAEEPLEDISADITRVQKTVLPLFLIPLTGVILFSFLFARKITNPIKKLVKGAEHIGKGDFDYNFSVPSHDEIGVLSTAFKQMVVNLKDAQGTLSHERDKLEDERNKLSSVLTNIDDGVVALDEDCAIAFINKAAEKIINKKSENILGKAIDNVLILKKNNQIVSLLPFIKNTSGGVNRSLFSIVMENDKIRVIQMKVSFLESVQTTKIRYILTVHDVTKEQELEDMKLDFVSMAAHELRTPLTSIRGYLLVLSDEIHEKLDKKQQMFLSRIDISTRQLIALVENLLSATKIEKGAFTVNKKPTDFINLVNDIAGDMKKVATEKRIKLEISLPKEKLAPLSLDPLGISEVVMNLLSNAISYSSPEGTISVWFEITNNAIITYIKDTGVGIPQSAIQHLFTKFFRVSGVLEQGSKGNGLGLYISKAIVELHGGKISVESVLHKGSTFSFSLPLDYGNKNDTSH